MSKQSKPKKSGMNKPLAVRLTESYLKGVHNGWNSFVMANFIAVSNVIAEKGYIPEELITPFCSDVEEELIRIFKDEMHDDPDDIEALTGAAIQARERLGLSEEPQLWDAAYGRLNHDSNNDS